MWRAVLVASLVLLPVTALADEGTQTFDVAADRTLGALLVVPPEAIHPVNGVLGPQRFIALTYDFNTVGPGAVALGAWVVHGENATPLGLFVVEGPVAGYGWMSVDVGKDPAPRILLVVSTRDAEAHVGVAEWPVEASFGGGALSWAFYDAWSGSTTPNVHVARDSLASAGNVALERITATAELSLAESGPILIDASAAADGASRTHVAVEMDGQGRVWDDSTAGASSTGTLGTGLQIVGAAQAHASAVTSRTGIHSGGDYSSLFIVHTPLDTKGRVTSWADWATAGTAQLETACSFATSHGVYERHVCFG